MRLVPLGWELFKSSITTSQLLSPAPTVLMVFIPTLTRYFSPLYPSGEGHGVA